MLSRELSNRKIKALRVGGWDCYSKLEMEDIANAIGQIVYEELLDNLDSDVVMANDAGRWILRGLCIGDAIYKARFNRATITRLLNAD